MSGLDRFDRLFVLTAFFLQAALLIFFAMRKWRFDTAMEYGWVVYALGVPAFIVSVILLFNGKSWQFWLGGFLITVWAIYGFTVDSVLGIQWRYPRVLPVLIPYVLLYLAWQMFYWFPLGTLYRPLWFIYAALFAVSTALNVTSHDW